MMPAPSQNSTSNSSKKKMLNTFLHETLCWLGRLWLHNPAAHGAADLRDAFLRFHAAVHPDEEEDVFRSFAMEAHIPGTAGYRMAKAGITLKSEDFNPINK